MHDDRMSRRQALKAGLAGLLTLVALRQAARGQSDEASGGAEITVHGDRPGPAIDPRFFGTNILNWIDDDEAMADGKIADYLEKMKCRLLRFPGGTVADNYLWKSNTLVDPRRFPNRGGPGTLDTDEFIALCRKIGADPLMCVNTEITFLKDTVEEGAQMAADWVHYCNIEKGYGVVFWEIGNEPYYHTRFTPSEYAHIFLTYAAAMKAVDPTIKVAAVGEWNPSNEGKAARIPESMRKKAQEMELQEEIGGKSDQPGGKNKLRAMETKHDSPKWWNTVLEIAGPSIDIVSEHWYFRPSQLPTMTETIEKTREICRQYVPQRDIPIILTEWDLGKDQDVFGLQRGLIVAEAAGRLLEGGVQMTTYWPMNCGEGNPQNLLQFRTMTPTPNYTVFQLMANNVGNFCLGSETGDSRLYSLATQSTDKKKVTLFILNRSGQARENLPVRFLHFEPDQFEAQVLTAADPAGDETHLDSAACEKTETGCTFTLPPWSMAVVAATAS